MSAVRCAVKVRVMEDSQMALDIALSKLKKRTKDWGILTEYLEHQFYQKPSVKRRERIKKNRSKTRQRNDR